MTVEDLDDVGDRVFHLVDRNAPFLTLPHPDGYRLCSARLRNPDPSLGDPVRRMVSGFTENVCGPCVTTWLAWAALPQMIYKDLELFEWWTPDGIQLMDLTCADFPDEMFELEGQLCEEYDRLLMRWEVSTSPEEPILATPPMPPRSIENETISARRARYAAMEEHAIHQSEDQRRRGGRLRCESCGLPLAIDGRCGCS